LVWILFYYNSLPDLPNECPYFSNEIMHRDFIKCNPTNTNHYEYPKFETLSYDEGCHPCEVNRYLDREDPEKYVVFYTRHTDTSRNSENKVVGYFKIGDEDYFTWKQGRSPKRGFHSSESVLLPKEHCISIEYTSRGVPVSWGSSSIKSKINETVRHLQENKKNSELNIYRRYQTETKEIMELLMTQSGREKIYNNCIYDCPFKHHCFFSNKLNKENPQYLDDLYRKYTIHTEEAGKDSCSIKKC